MIDILLVAYSLLLPGQPAATSINAPVGTQLLLQATGDGAQVYACTDHHWMLKAPDARLFDVHGKEIGTHFAGPTWRLNDGSEVKGKAVASQPAPQAGSVPWLLVQAVPGSGGGQLANVTYIRRTETQGGVAPAGVCSEGEQRVPYKASYSFYTSH